MKAFPTTYRNYDESIDHDCTGMELRDYFAAKALNASWVSSLDDLTRGEVKDIATACYILADAMMEARKK
jgi:hypothetical protein